MHGSLLLHSRPPSAPAIHQGVACIIPTVGRNMPPMTIAPPCKSTVSPAPWAGAAIPTTTPRPALVVASISAAGSVLFWRYGSESSVISVALFSICLPLMYVIVGGAARGFSGAIGWLLMRPTLRYLGKISQENFGTVE